MFRFRCWLTTLAACVLAACCLSGCHSTGQAGYARSEQHSDNPLIQSQPFLTKARAQQRKAMVEKAGYEVYLNLSDETSTRFTGRIVITMSLYKPDKPLLLDFQQGQIHRLLINSKAVQPDYNGQFLTLPRKHLNAGENLVEIEFSHDYSQTRSGLAMFRDPQDASHYVYTQPGIYATSQIAPVFDQPDIRASFKLTVRAPAQWQVISHSRERQAIGGGAQRWWYFPETRAISPSAFSLQAGPFKVCQGGGDQPVPLRVMVRQSQVETINHQQLFDSINHALTFYQALFEQPYPYFKYDIVTLPVDNAFPNFTSTSLLLNEKKLLPAASQDWAETRQAIFEHIAHSWTGGNTGVTWWDEQWLMNGLARYLSYLAMASTSEKARSDSWVQFYNQVKQPALFMDQLPGSQPLRQAIESNLAASENSSVRASKAAAVIQLLHHSLGDDAFRQGLQQFLQQHEGDNIQASVFFEQLQATSGQSLINWEKQWLESTGIQTVTADYQCKQGLLKKLQIHQIEPGKRSQLIHAGLFKEKQNTLQRYRTLPVKLDGKTTSVDIPGKQPCPDFVYPNVDDKGYVQVQLDADSMQKALRSPFNEPLMQAAVWHHLFHQPDSIRTLVHYASSHLPQETDAYSLKIRLTLLQQLSDQLLMLKVANPAVQTISTHWLLALEELAWQQLNIAEPDSPLQNLWFEFFLHIAHTDGGALQLRNLLDGRWDITGLTINQTRRWQIIIKLNAFSGKAARNSWSYAHTERDKDSSGNAEFMVQLADASRPDTLEKSQWLAHLEHMPAPEAKALSEVLFPAMQYPLVPALRENLFASLLNIQQKQSQPVFDQMIRHLLNECSANGIQQLERFSQNRQLSGNESAIQAQIQRAKQCNQLPKVAVFN